MINSSAQSGQGFPEHKGDLRAQDSDTNPNTDTLYAQPIAEQGGRPERKRGLRRKIATFLSGAVTVGVVGAGAYILGNRDNEQRDPGVAINPDTETSAPQTSGLETTGQSAPPEADVVTPLPEEGEGEGFTPPKRPEELIPSAELTLSSENISDWMVDNTNEELSASILTYEGRSASFDEVMLGGAWSFPKGQSASDGATTDETKATFKHVKDGGLAFRTDLAPLFDAARECEEANGSKDCAYKIDVERPTGGAPYPLYYNLESDDPGIPPQTIRVRKPVTDEAATVTITGYNKKTGHLINAQTFQTHIADVRYKDIAGKYHTTWIPFPTNRD